MYKVYFNVSIITIIIIIIIIIIITSIVSSNLFIGQMRRTNYFQ